MSYSERRCEGCNDTHDAAFWYYRRVPPGGYAYVCGVRYDAMIEKAGWERLEAGDQPIGQSGAEIRYCKGCDTPLSSPREFDQGYHDGCRPKPRKKPGGGRGRRSGPRR